MERYIAVDARNELPELGARKVTLDKTNPPITRGELQYSRLQIRLVLEIADLQQQTHTLIAGKGVAECGRGAERVLALGHAQHVAHRQEYDLVVTELERAPVRLDRWYGHRDRHPHYGHRRLRGDRLLTEGRRSPHFVEQPERRHPLVGKLGKLPVPATDVVAPIESLRAQIFMGDEHLIGIHMNDVDRVER